MSQTAEIRTARKPIGVHLVEQRWMALSDGEIRWLPHWKSGLFECKTHAQRFAKAASKGGLKFRAAFYPQPL